MPISTTVLNVRVWRGNAHGGGFVAYDVPRLDSQTVLDVVTYIQRELDASLSYRFACRVGMCGSCAMQVNGKPRWTCRSHVSSVMKGNTLTIEPLRNLPVVKDLACDLSPFFDKWLEAKGKFSSSLTREDALARISPKEKSRRAVDAAIECINCAVCYAACDVVENNPAYLGPAALNRAWSLINDARDDVRKARLRAVTDKGGCQNCHSQQGCTQHCPIQLNPTRSIAGLKLAALLDRLKR